MKCKYCNGDCPESDKNNTDFMCDGYLGDVDLIYKDECFEESDNER